MGLTETQPGIDLGESGLPTSRSCCETAATVAPVTASAFRCRLTADCDPFNLAEVVLGDPHCSGNAEAVGPLSDVVGRLSLNLRSQNSMVEMASLPTMVVCADGYLIGRRLPAVGTLLLRRRGASLTRVCVVG